MGYNFPTVSKKAFIFHVHYNYKNVFAKQSQYHNHQLFVFNIGQNMESMMRKLMSFMIIAVFLVACAAPRDVLKESDKNLIDIAGEEEEYELLVLDPGFESWFLTTWSPANDRSVEYYAMWNQRYVLEWNYKATQVHTSKLFDSTILYDPTTNYGMDVERKLYYYFRWVDTKLGIPILSSRPPGGML